MMLGGARRDVSTSPDPNEARRGTANVGGKRPAHRVRRDRLAEQCLDGRVDLHGPHRPLLVGEHTHDCILDPAGSPTPKPSARDRSRWRIAGPQARQLLREMT